MKKTCTLQLKFAIVGIFAAILTANAADPDFWSWANTPPMGWNSWDCYGAGVWQSNVIANADYMAKNLKRHGSDASALLPRDVSVSLADVGFNGSVKVRDLWNHKDLGSETGMLTRSINSHGAGLFRLHPQK